MDAMKALILLKLTVKSGLQKPYLYKSKAYKRNDAATIEVDTLEFSRLVLDGKNISFEELPCKDQELSFKILQCKLKENIYIETFNQDTLKTLNLYDNINGYNNEKTYLCPENIKVVCNSRQKCAVTAWVQIYNGSK